MFMPLKKSETVLDEDLVGRFDRTQQVRHRHCAAQEVARKGFDRWRVSPFVHDPQGANRAKRSGVCSPGRRRIEKPVPTSPGETGYYLNSIKLFPHPARSPRARPIGAKSRGLAPPPTRCGSRV